MVPALGSPKKTHFSLGTEQRSGYEPWVWGQRDPNLYILV